VIIPFILLFCFFLSLESNVSTYKLSYERSQTNRVRVGVIGPELADIIPEAVDILPKRVLPPLEKGGKPVVLTNVPIVNDQTLFFYGIGAAKELDSAILNLERQLQDQIDTFLNLQGEVTKIERMLNETSDVGSQLRIRETTAKAKLLKATQDLEYERHRNEEEYTKTIELTDKLQIETSESMTKRRLEQEYKAAKLRNSENARKKLKASQLKEAVRSKAAETLSKIEHERSLEKQRASEKIKAETEKVR